MEPIENIKTAIAEREEAMAVKLKEENIIEREVGSFAGSKVNLDTVLVITGPRRCGKSVLAFMLGKDKRFGYVNFEDERLSMGANNLNQVVEAIYSLKGEVELIIFDEIQNITGWEKFVARILGSKKLIITGSNARLLSKELSTFLTGRHIDITLFPFSFKEYLKFHNFFPDIYKTKDVAKIKNHLSEYLEKGGFPLSYRLGNIFLAELHKDIVERDIVQRYGIKHVLAIKDISKYLITNSAKEFTYNKLKEIVKIKSPTTAIKYVEYLKNAYLVFTLERFSYKLKEQMMAPKKSYCIDTGMINVIGGAHTKNTGAIVENAVFIELQRRKEKQGNDVFYYKDHQQREVDFVIRQNGKITQLMQVCYDLTNIQTKEREISSLLKASAELKCKNLAIITWNEDKEEIVDGRKIKYIPLWKWLLEDK